MKRFTVVFLAALACIFVLAAPALAQRDPFDPVVDLTVDATGGATTGDGTSDGTNGAGGPTSPSNEGAQADAFPNTGADTTGWLAIAYVLVASGGALVIFSRMDGPSPQRSPKRRRL